MAAPEVAAALLWDGARRARAAGQDGAVLKLARLALKLEPPRGEELSALVEALYVRGAVSEALPLARALASEVSFADDAERAERALLTLAELAESGRRAGAARSRRCGGSSPSGPSRRWPPSGWRRSSRAPTPGPGSPFSGATPSGLPARIAPRGGCAGWRGAPGRSWATWSWRSGCSSARRSWPTSPSRSTSSWRALLRGAGRAQDLMTQLAVVAGQHREVGQLPESISALEEAADLAESSGRVDEALSTLDSTREMLEEEKNLLLAARVERRRAELLRDARLDLAATEAALEKSFSLSGELYTARLGAALARQRDDARAEARWLLRAEPLCESPRERAAVLLELARLYGGPLANAEGAESSLREALRLQPANAEAAALLEKQLVREGRLGDLAAFREEEAGREADPDHRVALLLEAAALYRERAGRPHDAAAALLAARAVRPDDLALTAQVAELLHESGHAEDASEFDAILLEADPFRARVFDRHAAFLERAGDFQGLATLLLRRAQRQDGVRGGAQLPGRRRRLPPGGRPRARAALRGPGVRVRARERRGLPRSCASAPRGTCAAWRNCWPPAPACCRPRRPRRCCASAPSASSPRGSCSRRPPPTTTCWPWRGTTWRRSPPGRSWPRARAGRWPPSPTTGACSPPAASPCPCRCACAPNCGSATPPWAAAPCATPRTPSRRWLSWIRTGRRAGRPSRCWPRCTPAPRTSRACSAPRCGWPGRRRRTSPRRSSAAPPISSRIRATRWTRSSRWRSCAPRSRASSTAPPRGCARWGASATCWICTSAAPRPPEARARRSCCWRRRRWPRRSCPIPPAPLNTRPGRARPRPRTRACSTSWPRRSAAEATPPAWPRRWTSCSPWPGTPTTRRRCASSARGWRERPGTRPPRC